MKKQEKTEKITKDEIAENPGRVPLSDDELEKVTGGARTIEDIAVRTPEDIKDIYVVELRRGVY